MNRNSVNWHGSFAVIVTPFKQDGSIDEAGYRRIIDFIIDSGCHGVIAAGSTGEFFLMSAEERKRVFEICVDQTAGRVPVIACPAAIRTEEVVGHTQAAMKAGCDGVMVLPPLYVKITDREIEEFYKRVAGEGGLPLMLYNSPFAVNVYLTPKLIEKLVKIEEVVAIKDSSFDMLQFSNLVRTVKDEIRLFIGLEHLFVPALAIGADGAVAMSPPIAGRMASELYDSYVAGDHARAQELHVRMTRLYDIFEVGSMYSCIKESLKLQGMPGGYTRAPMLPFDDEQKAKLADILSELGLLEGRKAAE